MSNHSPKKQKALVQGEKSPASKHGFFSNPLLMITVFTPIVCAIVWIISWMYSR
jgi:hypothetical protein